MQIAWLFLLCFCHKFQNIRNADDKCKTLLFDAVKRLFSLKFTLYNNRSACVQGRCYASGMKTASVEPWGCVHCAVCKWQRKVYHNVMSGKYFIYACKAYAFLSACCSRSEKTQRFIKNVHIPWKFGICFRTAVSEFFIGMLWLRICGEYYFRSVFCPFQCHIRIFLIFRFH